MPTLDLRTAPLSLQSPRLRLEAPALHHAQAFSAGVQASPATLDFVAWRLRPCDLAWAQGFCQRDADSLGLLQREGVLRRHARDLDGRPCDRVLWAALNPRGPLPLLPATA